MILDFDCKKIIGHSCYDTMIAAISRFYGISIECSFINDFGFIYPKDNREFVHLQDYPIWNKFYDDNNTKIIRNLCGLDITNTIAEHSKDIETIINNYIKKTCCPIGIEMDSFYIPWNKFHKMVHRQHFFFILGCTNENYICADNFFENERKILDKKILHRNIFSYFSIKYDSELIINYSINEIIELIKANLNKKKDSHIRYLRQFADEIIFIKSREYEIFKSDIELSTLIFSLANMEWSRKNFANSLQSIGLKYKSNIFNTIDKDLMGLIIKWNNAKSLTIKSFLFNDTVYIERVKKNLADIANIEEKIIEMILNL